MLYWFDTEFIEAPTFIDLISIGIVSEDGRELYLESNEVNWKRANDWVLANVRPQLSGGEAAVSRENIAAQVLDFTVRQGDKAPVFWAYYADYDWVAFCWLFGSMIDLPPGFPMYCRDIKQWCDDLGNPRLPAQPRGEHNALEDARWNHEAWKFLAGYPVKAEAAAAKPGDHVSWSCGKCGQFLASTTWPNTVHATCPRCPDWRGPLTAVVTPT